VDHARGASRHNRRVTEPNESARASFLAGFDRTVATGELPWETLADDFVWDMSNVAWPERDEYTGRDGVSEFMRDWTSQWDDWQTKPVEMIEVGDQMVVISIQSARAKGSGVPVEMTYAQIWTRTGEGLASRARMYESREEALAVAEAERDAPAG
jgi:ketosteroid isomerase-like protein